MNLAHTQHGTSHLPNFFSLSHVQSSYISHSHSNSHFEGKIDHLYHSLQGTVTTKIGSFGCQFGEGKLHGFPARSRIMQYSLPVRIGLCFVW
jgi:hypothetical protein